MSLLLTGLLSVSSAVWAETPPALKLPLVVWDINFNDNPIDAPPPPLTKEQIEAETKLTEWERLPIRRCGKMDYITKTRQALVVQEAAGLKDKPLLLAYTEGRQPHWGPRVWIQIPPEVARQGTVWTLTFDVAKGNIEKSGGVSEIRGLFGLKFFEDGMVKAGTTEVARYAANKPLHFEFRIDTVAKTVAITVDGNTARTIIKPWGNQKVQFFEGITLNGLFPGGHGRAPSTMVFDNIKLVMEK